MDYIQSSEQDGKRLSQCTEDSSLSTPMSLGRPSGYVQDGGNNGTFTDESVPSLLGNISVLQHTRALQSHPMPNFHP